ncbi:MAG: DUF4190 domain-containing protein [Planctomycetota bacterium]|jgi:hypothetical protein
MNEEASVPKTSGLATASLVLAILGVLCGLTALPALVLGIVALVEIRRRPQELTGRGMAVAGIVVSAFVLVVLMPAAIFVGLYTASQSPGLAEARLAAMKVRDKSNLHLVSLGSGLYCAEHGEYPASLDILLKEGHLIDQEVLLAPADEAPRPLGETSLLCSYEYVGALPTDIPETTITCYTRKGVYPGGRNVVYADMAVNWVSEAELAAGPDAGRQSLRASYEALVRALGDELTPEREAQLREFYEIEDGPQPRSQ